MSRSIHDDHRHDHGRALIAEQQAARLARAQQVPAAPQTPFLELGNLPPSPSEIQTISREGLIGSKRLAQDLEGMLRDKPKFLMRELREQAREGESGADGVSSPQASSEFTAFTPGEPASELPIFNPGPRRPAEDPDSRDLNLSPQNRERAMTQGVPSSATGKAAMQMFLQPQQPQSTPKATEAPAQAADSAQAASSTAPAETGAAAPSAPESVDPLLSRASTNFDRSQISTASENLGETAGVTDNELVLDRGDGTAADTIRQELGRQTSAGDESERRAGLAQSSLDTARGRERQLNSQREQLESAKAGQRANADETQRIVDVDNERLQRHSANVEQVQKAGEASLTRINNLDSQVQQNAAARDQASNDAAAGQQSVASLQNQVDSLQRQAPSAPSPPKESGNSGKTAPGQEDKNAQERAAYAQSQAAISSAQSQLAQAQKAQEDARRRQEQAEAALQANQQAATAERNNLDQLRGQLERGQQARNESQARAQDHRTQLQHDNDRVKELSGHNQDINSQFEEVAAAKDRALDSLEMNRANASAARANAEQLQELTRDGVFSDQSRQNQGSEGSGQPAAQNEGRPVGNVTINDSGSVESNSLNGGGSAGTRAAQRGPGPMVSDQGEKVVVRLQSLNQGANSSSTDTSSSASRRRSGVEGADDLGQSSLAAANAAANPTGNSNNLASSNEGFRGDSGRGRGHDDDDHGPPEHSNAGGNGRGRGKG